MQLKRNLINEKHLKYKITKNIIKMLTKIKRRYLKNKKGDIPTVLLIVGVIALCGLAIFIFVTSLNQAKGSFDYVEEVEKANLEIEKDSLNNYHEEINESESIFKFWKKEE